jgi:hypothetical protein
MLIPRTEGEISLYQGRDCTFTVSVLDETTGEAQAATGYELAMQIRATIDSEIVIVEVSDYATSSPTALTADVVIPGGISGALDQGHAFTQWVADAKFVKTGSNPELATDAGRFTVNFYPEITRA